MSDENTPHTAPLPPEQLPEHYPHTADLAALRRGELPPSSAGVTWVRVAVAAGVLTVLISVVGLILAWRDADAEGDEFRQQLNAQISCPRSSAVEFDSAIGESVKVLLAQNTLIDGALVAVGRSDEAALQEALAGVDELNASAQEVLALLDTAIKAREASIELCR